LTQIVVVAEQVVGREEAVSRIGRRRFPKEVVVHCLLVELT
jgi:hypothetical protein